MEPWPHGYIRDAALRGKKSTESLSLRTVTSPLDGVPIARL